MAIILNAGAGLVLAERQFRKVIGYRQIPFDLHL
jgi:hypothetical protein